MSDLSLPVRRLVKTPLLPWRMGRDLWSQRELIAQLTRRNIEGRYRGSALGALWAVLTPLVMLAIYTFVFTVIFDSTWPGLADGGVLGTAAAIFCGILVFNLFSETLSAAPAVIVQNASYVKRTVFPTEILPLALLLTSAWHSMIGAGVLIVALLLIQGTLHWTVVFVPLLYLPLLALTQGLAWFLASLGVFLRDVGNVVALLLQAAFFLTPVIYSEQWMIDQVGALAYLNPLTGVVQQLRDAAIFGRVPSLALWAATTAAALLVMALGWVWFMRTKRAFADVI
jgi:lipopolysaccharide transport system permease protein